MQLFWQLKSKIYFDLHFPQVKLIPGKGRGVVATKDFNPKDFLCEYAGDLLSMTEAKAREDKYKQDSSIGCFMYYFVFKDKHLWWVGPLGTLAPAVCQTWPKNEFLQHWCHFGDWAKGKTCQPLQERSKLCNQSVCHARWETQTGICGHKTCEDWWVDIVRRKKLLSLLVVLWTFALLQEKNCSTIMETGHRKLSSTIHGCENEGYFKKR